MPRVSTETIRKLNDFLDSLPEEPRRKCAYCNETLTHLCKLAEAQTGAGTATVTRELADRINDGAAPGDRVKGRSLLDKVRNTEGKRKVDNVNNNPAPEPGKTPRLHVVESDDTIDKLLSLLQRAAKMAEKAKGCSSFSERMGELTKAVSIISFVLTETREDVKWV